MLPLLVARVPNRKNRGCWSGKAILRIHLFPTVRRGERAIAEVNPFADVQEFCEINAELISSGSGRSRSLLEQAEDQKTFEETLNGFSERGKTIVKGLQSLGQIHPFVGGEFRLVLETAELLKLEV